MKVYFEDFRSRQDVIDSFNISMDDLKDIEIIYAAYNTEEYQGDAQVIFYKGRSFYEVNGSHCSCVGLDGQWQPERTAYKALMTRPNVSTEAKKNLESFKKKIS